MKSMPKGCINRAGQAIPCLDRNGLIRKEKGQFHPVVYTKIDCQNQEGKAVPCSETNMRPVDPTIEHSRFVCKNQAGETVECAYPNVLGSPLYGDFETQLDKKSSAWPFHPKTPFAGQHFVAHHLDAYGNFITPPPFPCWK